MHIKHCEKCKNEFVYQVTSMNVPGGKDKENIICPYCNEMNGYEITSGFVFSYKLAETQNV